MPKESFKYKNKEGKEVTLDSVLGKGWGWTLRGLQIIKHAEVQKLALIEDLYVVDHKILVTPTGDNMQQHVMSITIGRVDSVTGASQSTEIGEASRLNTGKQESSDLLAIPVRSPRGLVPRRSGSGAWDLD